MLISDQARAVAATGGYSEDRYCSWPAVAQGLLDGGYSPVEAEAIMRSKWTRWAADCSDAAYGQASFADLEKLIESSPRHFSPTAVAELVAQTLSEL